MTLRPDEAFVLDRLVAHFGGPQVATGWEGEDPPDIYLTVTNSTVAVEITQLTPVVLKPDGTVENHLSQDLFGVRLLDDLDKEYRDKLGADALLVHLRTPVTRPRQFKKSIRRILDSLVSAGRLPETWQEFNVEGEEVGFIRVPPHSDDGKRITGFVENMDSNSNIDANAAVILGNRLEIKERICGGMAWTGKRWLALLNRYWLADEHTYDHAYRGMGFLHGFSKVLLISESGVVHELSRST